ncbi:MAG: serine O-acetyltransferase [Verrucomicrobiota bacterium]
MNVERENVTTGDIWSEIIQQAEALETRHEHLRTMVEARVLSHHSMAEALSAMLSTAIAGVEPLSNSRALFDRVLCAYPTVEVDSSRDLVKLAKINPACPSMLVGLLSFQGFQAIQLYRVANKIWLEGNRELAAMLQNWGARAFSVDIHPAAQIGREIFLDHAIGFVVGETAVIEDGVNIWHGVTLGSTLTEAGDRHPKVRRNATLCAGATILGNIEIGAGAIVAANSVVLASVEPGTVVAGAPARKIAQSPTSLKVFNAAQEVPSNA